MRQTFTPEYRRKLSEAAKRRDPSTRRNQIKPGQRGESNPAWKGGRWVHQPSGYVLVTTLDGPRYEHRMIAERELGRALLPGEVVHHYDGDRSNNAPANLAVFATHSDHLRYESLMRALA